MNSSCLTPVSEFKASQAPFLNDQRRSNVASVSTLTAAQMLLGNLDIQNVPVFSIRVKRLARRTRVTVQTGGHV